MATPIPPQVTDVAPDSHVAELVRMARHYEAALAHFQRSGVNPDMSIVQQYRKRAAAIRWILSETAHSVDGVEVVT